jgi:hypothetical protein
MGSTKWGPLRGRQKTGRRKTEDLKVKEGRIGSWEGCGDEPSRNGRGGVGGGEEGGDWAASTPEDRPGAVPKVDSLEARPTLGCDRNPLRGLASREGCEWRGGLGERPSIPDGMPAGASLQTRVPCYHPSGMVNLFFCSRRYQSLRSFNRPANGWDASGIRSGRRSPRRPSPGRRGYGRRGPGDPAPADAAPADPAPADPAPADPAPAGAALAAPLLQTRP